MKKKAENTEGTEKKSLKKKQDEQLKWILIVMGIILVVAVLVYFIVQSTKKFEYGGLNFEKIMFDKLPLYHTQLPANYQGKSVLYNLYFRNDPRKLEEIEISGNIRLTKNLIFSVDPEAEVGCSDSGIAGANLGNLLRVAGITINQAYNNKTYADERDKSYATCNNSDNLSVILLEKSSETSIRQENENCYVIRFNDCEILNATERFMVAAIANSRGIRV